MIVKPRRQLSDAEQRQSFVNGGTSLFFTADRQKREHGDWRRGNRDAAAPAGASREMLCYIARRHGPANMYGEITSGVPKSQQYFVEVPGESKILAIVSPEYR